MGKHPLNPIFQDICLACQSMDSRYELTRPHVRKGHVYATDGRIAVRSGIYDVALPPLCAEGANTPDVLGLFAECERNPFVLLDTRKLCRYCLDGCEFCWWTNEAVSDHVTIGGVKFNARYLTLLLKHGVNTLEVGANDQVPARFVVDETCEGLLMPMVSR